MTARANGQRANGGVHPRKAPVRLLIVEDSEDDALLLVRELRRAGYAPTFERVETADAMTEALAKQKWDIVFADSNAPVFPGTDALELLRRNGLDVPFIVVSARMMDEAAAAALKAGAHDYISKGDLKRLIPTVERELREAELRKEGRRIEAHVKYKQDQIRVLHNIHLAITETLDLRSTADLLFEKIDLLLPYPIAITLKLFNKQSGELEPVAYRNLEPEVWKAEAWKSGRDLAQLVLESKAPLLISDLQTSPGVRDPDFFRQHRLASYLGIPLAVNGNTLGVLGLYTTGKHQFSLEEVEFFIVLANPLAVTIRHCQLYEQVKDQIQDLQTRIDAKSELLGILSQEMRSPLSTVVGYAGMVMDGRLGEVNVEQRKALARVIGHAYELVSLIVALLEAEKPAVQDIDLNRFLDELRSAYEFPLQKELVVVWDYPRDLPGIKTDGWKLKHILQTLINDAIKFTDKGGVTIGVHYHRDARMVEFKVTATSGGIPEASMPFIFEMFHSSGSPSIRGYAGMGWGLHIVKRFTEMLGGKISVEREPGKGSVFTVSLPSELGKTHEPDRISKETRPEIRKLSRG